jgi:hypothetical protein
MTIWSRRWLVGTALYASVAGSLLAVGSATQLDVFWQAAYVMILPVGYVVAMIASIVVVGALDVILGVGGDAGPLGFFVAFCIGAIGAVANAFVAWAAGQMTRDVCRSRGAKRGHAAA